MIILGLGCAFEHDPAAALLIDGKLVAAAEEERFSRNKHAIDELPTQSIKFVLEEAGIGPEDVQVVAYPWSYEAYTEKRWDYVKRTLRSKPSHAYKALIKSRDRRKRALGKAERALRSAGIDPQKVEFVCVEHHLAHASSSYHFSGYRDAAIMSIDGKGEFVATLIAHGVDGKIEKLHEILEPDSLGLFYATVTDYLGFQHHNGEYKVMGMSAYGDATKIPVEPLLQKTADGYRVNDDLVWVKKALRHKGHRYAKELIDLWGPAREGEGLSEPYIHIAAAAQVALEDAVLAMIDTHLADILRNNGGHLCLAGGCALNVRMNRRILNHPLVQHLYVPPAAGDSGTSVGAAAWLAQQRGETIEPMVHAYYGPSYDDAAIEAALAKFRIPFVKEDDEACLERATQLLADGQIISWMQGPMEFGPRALGNRSILGNPCVPGTSDEINQRIKFREKWRPFCPSMLAEDAQAILGSAHPSRFMTLSFTMSEEWKAKIPEVVHVDGSCRPQTVSQETNPRFYELLSRFKARTGVPVLINTSLNRRGEPMVCSPEDALNMLFGSGLEHLFIGNYYITKKRA